MIVNDNRMFAWRVPPIDRRLKLKGFTACGSDLRMDRYSYLLPRNDRLAGRRQNHRDVCTLKSLEIAKQRELARQLITSRQLSIFLQRVVDRRAVLRCEMQSVPGDFSAQSV